MLQILTGENQFLVDNFIRQLAKQQDLEAQVIDADWQDNVLDLILAQDLFRAQKLIVLKNLTNHQQLVEQIIDRFDQFVADSDLFLLIVEPKLDKRLKLAKKAQAAKLIQSFPLLKDYDRVGGIKLIQQIATQKALTIDQPAAERLWQLIGNNSLAQANVLDQLAVFERPIDSALVEQYVAPTLRVDSFVVIDKVFAGNQQAVAEYLNQMELANLVPQMFWALIISQITNLVAVKNLDSDQLKQLKIHPFVIKKLTQSANRVKQQQLKSILEIMDQTDYQLKTVASQDWLLIKIALIKISQFFK